MTRSLFAAVAFAFVAASLVGVGLTAERTAPRAEPETGAAVPTPVLVELFTSEGCSSCPPADALLRELVGDQPIDGAYVIGLSEHVDYWNRLGWHDPFSSPSFSARQQTYGRQFQLASIYTPQAIVDGTVELVGSDRDAVRRAIADAARAPKAPLSIAVTPEADGVRVVLDGNRVLDQPDTALVVALVENDLSVHVTSGENASRQLRHSAVARAMQTVMHGQRSVRLPIDPAWNGTALDVVAFAQDRRTLAIRAAAIAPLAR
ncbi:MAG: DUF1223 domain-containing protein [Vicinamibacterales bacterium]